MLILASQSPRRRQLLEEAGYTFQVIVPDTGAECGICSRETPPEMVARLAFQKAANVACKVSEGIVLGSDTIAECMGNMLGKPEHREHARQMLSLLRGRIHTVYTGVCLWHAPFDRRMVRVASAKIKMHEISDMELDGYLDTEAWVGKAGAFGFQDGPDWLELLEGDATTVVGLPMDLLREMLSQFSQAN